MIKSKKTRERWFCDTCQTKGQQKKTSVRKTCVRCSKDKPDTDFDKPRSRHDVCHDCAYPKCNKCSKPCKRKSIWTPHPQEKSPVALCDDCEGNF